MKHVSIINGHPDKKSYTHDLSEAYAIGAKKTNATITQINLLDLDFNPNLKFGYRQRTELEPNLLDAIDKIKKENVICSQHKLPVTFFCVVVKKFKCKKCILNGSDTQKCDSISIKEHAQDLGE